MAESYFELLTEQRGFPAKPFDPLEELKCLRRRLAARIHNHEIPGLEFIGESALPHFQGEFGTKEVPPSEPVSLDSVVKQVSFMKKTLALWHRSRHRAKFQSQGIFRSHQKILNRRRFTSLIAQYLDTPKEGLLEMLYAGLMVLGAVGVVFGFLSFYRGWESDLTLGSLVCASGATVIAIGTTGLLLASWFDPVVKQ